MARAETAYERADPDDGCERGSSCSDRNPSRNGSAAAGKDNREVQVLERRGTQDVCRLAHTAGECGAGRAGAEMRVDSRLLDL